MRKFMEGLVQEFREAPPSMDPAMPAALFGDWRDAGVYQSYGRVLAASGLVAIPYSKRYARGPTGTANGAEDSRDLIAYVREHAPELHVDKERIALWTFSAGGLEVDLGELSGNRVDAVGADGAGFQAVGIGDFILMNAPKVPARNSGGAGIKKGNVASTP